MSTLRGSLVVAGLICLTGCKKSPPDAPVAKAPAEAVVAAGDVASAGETLTGLVAERLEAPGYTYLRQTGPAGEIWAAVPTSPVAVGTRVTIASPMPMENFESKTLKRTFPVVMFGTSARAVGAGTQAMAPAPALPEDADAAALSPKPLEPPVDVSNIKVTKAAGPDGRTVAEVCAQRMELKDKTISVRGKVVKVTSGVLGHTWIHLRDGSGSDAAQDNDLIVTTREAVHVNDEITAQGVVHVDKDLGSGYSYKVLIEEATLTP